MEHLDHSQGIWVSHEILVSALKYLGKLQFRDLGLPKKHLCQPQNTWISCQKPGSAMEHLGQTQGIWISHETLVSALRYLAKQRNTSFSLKVL